MGRTLTLSILLLHTSDSRPIIVCFLGFFAGIFLFVRGFRLLQRRHLILDTPVSKVRSASMGMVELSGLATGPYTLISPITARPCFYYRSVAWEYKRQGKSSQWVKAAAECMHVPFFLDDNTGKVLVDPRGADLDLHRDFQEEFCDSFFSMKEEAPANVRSFLSRHGVSTSIKIKVEEFCIKPKNALFLLGTLQENPGLEVTSQPIQDDDFTSFSGNLGQSAFSFITGNGGGLDLSLSGGLQHDPAYDPIYDKAISRVSTRVINLSPAAGPTQASEMTQQQKIAAALLKAGITSPAAWAAAHVNPSELPAYGNAGGSHDAKPADTSKTASSLDEFDLHPPVVMMKGKNDAALLISWRSQRDLARSLGWKCTLMIWGGPALCLVSLYALNVLTHWL